MDTKHVIETKCIKVSLSHSHWRKRLELCISVYPSQNYTWKITLEFFPRKSWIYSGIISRFQNRGEEGADCSHISSVCHLLLQSLYSWKEPQKTARESAALGATDCSCQFCLKLSSPTALFKLGCRRRSHPSQDLHAEGWRDLPAAHRYWGWFLLQHDLCLTGMHSEFVDSSDGYLFYIWFICKHIWIWICVVYRTGTKTAYVRTSLQIELAL